MADHELQNISETVLAEMVTDTQLGDMIKPLVNEIHLFDSYVAGTTYIPDKSVLEEIKAGDKLHMYREKENKFDNNAIVIKTETGKKLGYVSEKDNIIFARLMDAGKMLIGKIKNIDKKSSSFMKISIGIYLVDF